MFHADLFYEVSTELAKIPRCGLHLSTCSADNAATLERMFSGWPGGLDIRLVPNRGRDIAPKLITFRDAHAAYDLVLHLHTKSMDEWRRHIFQRLIGSPELVRGTLICLASMTVVGMAAGSHYPPIAGEIRWGVNREHGQHLCQRMGVEMPKDGALDFPSGSMFWARPQALKPLFDLNLAVEDFPEEAGQKDGTIAHAIERLFYVSASAAGFSWLTFCGHRPVTPHRLT